MMKIAITNLTNADFYMGIEKEKGLGASDAAVINNANSMSYKGHEVTIFGQFLTTTKNDEGVVYAPFMEAQAKGDWDLLICNRNPIHYEKFNAKKKVLWMHDDIDAPVNKGISGIIDIFDHVVVLSKYHKRRVQTLSEKKLPFIIIPEGIADSAVQAQAKSSCREETAEWTFLYASAPFKGLPVLIKKIWSMVKEILPNAKLRVCSSMKLYGLNQNDVFFKKMYDDMRADPSIIYEPVLTNTEIFDVMSECDAMLYPNTFNETFCNSVNEALFMGLPVITSRIANLPDLVEDGVNGYTIGGNPLSEDYAKAFISALGMMIYDEEKYKSMRLHCLSNYHHALSWLDCTELFLSKIGDGKERFTELKEDY